MIPGAGHYRVYIFCRRYDIPFSVVEHNHVSNAAKLHRFFYITIRHYKSSVSQYKSQASNC